MRVIDSGVVVELLAGNLSPERIGEEELAAPHLIDSEVTHVLRGLVRSGDLSDRQADVALQGFTELTWPDFRSTGAEHRRAAGKSTRLGVHHRAVALSAARTKSWSAGLRCANRITQLPTGQ